MLVRRKHVYLCWSPPTDLIKKSPPLYIMKSPDDAAAKVYDIVYDDYTNKEITDKEINFIASQIRPNGTILDIGCGTGRHMIPLIKMGYTLTGIDNSKEMLKVLLSKLEAQKLKAETINKNILEITNFNKEYDGTICFWNAITQMATTEKQGKHLFNILFKSLKPGGKLIIEMTYPESHKPHENLHESKVTNAGKTYETTFETIQFDERTKTTISNETVRVLRDGKVIEVMKAQLIQKWWSRDELTKLCKDEQFSNMELYGGDYNRFKEPSDKLILVATK